MSINASTGAAMRDALVRIADALEKQQIETKKLNSILDRVLKILQERR